MKFQTAAARADNRAGALAALAFCGVVSVGYLQGTWPHCDLGMLALRYEQMQRSMTLSLVPLAGKLRAIRRGISRQGHFVYLVQNIVCFAWAVLSSCQRSSVACSFRVAQLQTSLALETNEQLKIFQTPVPVHLAYIWHFPPLHTRNR